MVSIDWSSCPKKWRERFSIAGSHLTGKLHSDISLLSLCSWSVHFWLCGILDASCHLHWLDSYLLFHLPKISKITLNWLMRIQKQNHPKRLCSDKSPNGYAFLTWIGKFDSVNFICPLEQISIISNLYFRLLNYFSEIYDITLTLIFVGCTVTIAVALLMIQQELVQTDFTQFHLIIVHRIDYTFIVLFRTLRRQISDEIDSVMLFEAILCGFWSILVVFVACEFGQRFSDALDSCDDKLAQLDWYLVPRRIQRMLPMIILNSQQPMIVQCFGNVPCGRETFKKVRWRHKKCWIFNYKKNNSENYHF